MKFIWRCLAVLLLLGLAVCAAAPVLAAESAWADRLRQARESLRAGDTEGAYRLALEAFETDPDHPEINFLLGRAAFDRGDFESALMAFERVLIAAPATPRVQLEMARTLFQLGSYEEARALFRQVLASDPPPAVRGNIDTFLAAIARAVSPHTFGGTLSLGFGYDDNVRAAPADERVRTALGDVVLTGSGASAQSDLITSATLSLTHSYRFPAEQLAWKTTAVSYNAFYRDEDDLDLRFLSLTTGPALRGSRTLWEVYALANYLILDADRYLGSYGLGSNLGIAFGPRVVLNFGGRVEEKTFFSEPDRDATSVQADLGPTFRWGPNLAEITLGAEAENADADVHSYDRWTLGLLYQRTLPGNFSAFTAYRYQESDYEEPEALFAERRRDRVHAVSAGVSRLLWRPRGERGSLSAQFSYTYTDADSTIDLYQYDKNVTSLVLTYGF